MPRTAPPLLRTAPVLAVLVCHDGEPWLPQVLSALRNLSVRPRHVLAVDTGSVDGTADLLAEAAEGERGTRLLDGVLTLPRETGFGAAVYAAVDHAVDRWGDPGSWVWLLHDDCAPEADALVAMLTATEMSPSVGVVGPLVLDWTDPRLVVEAGLATDASGHRQTGIGPAELDWGRFHTDDGDRAGTIGRFEQSTEVLAVGTAGALIRRDVWEELGGFDPAMPLAGEDIDFGWRANEAGHLVLCVPGARVRHARAASRGKRTVDALPASLRGKQSGTRLAAAERAHGLRTFLVNCAPLSFVLGLPRLAALTLLRALGFTFLRRFDRARAEWAALGSLVGGRARLLAARRERRRTRRVGRGARGLLVGRISRLRNAFRNAIAYLVRRRIQADMSLGRLPTGAGQLAVWATTTEPGRRRPVGPETLPAGAIARRDAGRVGLRQPARTVVVPVDTAAPRPRPRPGPGGRDAAPDLVLVDMGAGRVLRELALAPPVLLVAALTLLALGIHSARLGLDPAGGRLLPLGGLADTWREYLAAWHPVHGGTATPAPAALAVVGLLGAVLGGPPAAVALLILSQLPLAGLSAYFSTRRAPVHRPVRAVVAAGYALLPAATAGAAQGRLDAVVAHVLIPPVLAGVVAVLWPPARGNAPTSWLSTAAATALGLAVLGAFSPLGHLMVLAVALVGFVLVPGRPGDGRRRLIALATVVLAPLAVLLPWPAAVLTHPGVVLHGIGAAVPEQPVPGAGLIALYPGGPGAVPWLGVLFVLAGAVAVLIRPRAVLPGLGVVALAALAVGALLVVPAAHPTGGPAQHAWPGVPLLFAGCGLLWAVLAACQPGPVRRIPDRTVALASVIGIGALAAGALWGGREGPLRMTGGPALSTTVAEEAARAGSGVLFLADGRARLVAGRSPRFGDDDLAPTGGASTRLASWGKALRSGSEVDVRATLAALAASGVRHLVLPDRPTADRIRVAAGRGAIDSSPTPDGRPVLRVLLPNAPAVLLSAEQATRARSGGTPPAEPGARGVVVVEQIPSDVAVRTSDGPKGRLLVLAAAQEPGWRAEIDGKPVELATAWGHQVAVPVPAGSAEIRVDPPAPLRPLLLLVQLAATLFLVITAVPARRR
ncbi:glycosyl transferase [Longimycelium tulufanense]|uniref:Glycosyl transferase n=1 Tax=Longimycelium tulufanense TaxID=907463 RepID=A0A8J3CF71_9PSEU|nr:glycosyltransferase family 2 protein [Longimycelium tulufanense]GGM66474.1 glycosyl transferase [Longimycelium tulufanense]